MPHLFKVGSAVSLASNAMAQRPSGKFIVEAHMPPVGTALQYRIKSEAEGFRRVVVETELTSFGAPAAVPSRVVPPPDEGGETD